MAKAPYKKEAEKKDKALRFRISNQLYDQLKKLSQKGNMGVNTLARKLLTDYLKSKYPRVEQRALEDLKRDKAKLEEYIKTAEEEEHYYHTAWVQKRVETTELYEKRESLRAKIAMNRDLLETFKIKIKQIEESRG